MTQAEVTQSEDSEFIGATPDSLYFQREIGGFAVTVKYNFTLEGRLWGGIYRVTAEEEEERYRAFDTFRAGNRVFHGPPTATVCIEVDGRFSDVPDDTEIRLAAPELEFAWQWALPSWALTLRAFRYEGGLEVWMSYETGALRFAVDNQIEKDPRWIGTEPMQPKGKGGELVS